MTDQENNAADAPKVASPLRSTTTHAVTSPTTQVYNDLRRRIIDLELKPNTVLSRAELARFYNVSQSPLRESLQRLERDGLITVHPQSKTLVSYINVQQVHETQFLRVALEIEVVRRLALQSNISISCFSCGNLSPSAKSFSTTQRFMSLAMRSERLVFFCPFWAMSANLCGNFICPIYTYK